LHPQPGRLAYIRNVDAHFAEPTLMDGMAAADAVPGSLERARGGDLLAFRELLRAHKARVFSIALRFTGRRADAEELAQDVFLKLHGTLAQIESDAHLKHWLLRTVSHRCIDRLRHDSRQPQLVPIDAIAEGMEPVANEAGHDPLAGARLRRLLRELAPDARAVMLLRFQEDLDPAEIASVLAMSVNTVKSHLRRSLDWMRAQMAGDKNGS
jgi:RNA polymerase sigma-70 factor (ECF subfamily)